MAIVYLYGHLGRKYGRRFELAVYSVSEALRLLNANFRGFTADVARHQPGFMVSINGSPAGDIGQLQERHISPEIHIVPAIAGAGGDNSGLGKIVIAAAMVVAAYYGNFSPATTQFLYRAALSLAISGVTQMLFSAKQSENSAELTGETTLVSYSFNGPVNTTAQGNPVPVLYGLLRVGSQVVSAGITTE